MISLTYHYYISTINAAGMVDCEKVEETVDFDYDDIDQAYELAERHWEAPENYIDGTLNITLA